VDYEDESYVRLYTRDSPSWKALGWKGQTVLMHMIRDKFDRNGVFVYGPRTASRAIAIVTGVPEDFVQEGLEALLAEDVWSDSGDRLVWKNFKHAQTCKKSDRLRKKDSRTAASGHNLSQDVTLSLTEPNLAKPSIVGKWKRFPTDFVPDDTHKKIANEFGIDLNFQLELIKDHEFKEPKTDAAATFRTWLRNSKRFSNSVNGVVMGTPTAVHDNKGRRQI
jgi:hypothetical protein